MSTAKRPTIDVLNNADQQFKRYDKHHSGAITSFACINALENIFSDELTQTDLDEIRSSLEDIVEPEQFNDIVLKIKKNKQEQIIIIDEDFIVQNYSKTEIRLFRDSWFKFDKSNEGVLNFENTRKTIEKVLKNYKNSKNNDSEIKQFFIKKANNGKSIITYAEYMNFISKFINYRSLTYKKPALSCFGF